MDLWLLLADGLQAFSLHLSVAQDKCNPKHRDASNCLAICLSVLQAITAAVAGLPWVLHLNDSMS